jgi:neutral ceramidase
LQGDVSPNIEGAHCQNTGQSCDGSHGDCDGNPHLCIARGPGYSQGLSHFWSTETIGRRQYQTAKRIVSSNSSIELTGGPILFQHAFVDMTNIKVSLPDGSTGKTCNPAMGYAFSAGTTDGVGTRISYVCAFLLSLSLLSR